MQTNTDNRVCHNSPHGFHTRIRLPWKSLHVNCYVHSNHSHSDKGMVMLFHTTLRS